MVSVTDKQTFMVLKITPSTNPLPVLFYALRGRETSKYNSSLGTNIHWGEKRRRNATITTDPIAEPTNNIQVTITLAAPSIHSSLRKKRE